MDVRVWMKAIITLHNLARLNIGMFRLYYMHIQLKVKFCFAGEKFW